MLYIDQFARKDELSYPVLIAQVLQYEIVSGDFTEHLEETIHGFDMLELTTLLSNVTALIERLIKADHFYIHYFTEAGYNMIVTELVRAQVMLDVQLERTNHFNLMES